jgi:PAS domain S-box-containing protein
MEGTEEGIGASMKVALAGGVEPEADFLAGILSNSGFEPISRRIRTSDELFRVLDENDVGALFLFDDADIDSIATALRIRERGSFMPLILISKPLSDDAAVRLLKAGIDSILHTDSLKEAGALLEGEMERARKRAEHARVSNAIQTVANEWRTAVDTVLSPFCLVDLRGKIVRCNKAFQGLSGKPFLELVGSGYEEILGGIGDSKDRTVVGPAAASSAELVFVTMIRDRTFEVHIVPAVDAAGKPTGRVHVMNDITERAKAEETARRLQEHLARVQKLEAVGQLAGGIAHDFNNLLTGIMGYCSILLSRLPAADPLRPFVEKVVSASRRAAELTQGLLTFARRQPFKPRPADLNAVVTGSGDFMQRVAGEAVGIRLEPCPSPLPVFIDAGQVEQLLLNLSTNARDAMAGGGAITVRTESDATDADHPLACIVFSDTGIGMSREIMEHVFEPFFTTKEVGKGTGLGLSMIWSIVEQHGGKIAVDSVEGKGTSFRVSFPMVRIGAQAAVPGKDIGGKETILFAEDDESVRDMTKAILEGLGYTVLPAVDGEEALVKFGENGGKISLAILDIVLPKRDGISVFDELRRRKPDIRGIFISGYANEVLDGKGMKKAPGNFLRKPFTPLALGLEIRKVLDERSHDGEV